MKHRLKFLFGLLFAIPLLPLIAFQAKQIRRTVPKLIEAKHPEGITDFGFKETKSVLYMGESTVAGVGVDTHDNGFAGSTSRELARLYQYNINWKVVSRSGYTAKMVRRKLLRQIGDFTPDLIILGLGANDAFKLHSPWKWRIQVIKLIRALYLIYPNTSIAFTNMPPIKEFPAFTKSIKFTVGNLVEILGAELNSLLKQFNNVIYASDIIRVEDWVHLLMDTQNPSDFFSDGVHPSELTYQVWGKEFARFIHKSEINL